MAPRELFQKTNMNCKNSRGWLGVGVFLLAALALPACTHRHIHTAGPPAHAPAHGYHRHGIHSARVVGLRMVTRRLPDGSIFNANEAMTRMQALESYTINNAHAAFEEDVKGTLTPGKYADITVLSKDILTIPDDEIRDTKVVYTIIGGEVKYEAR